MTTMTDQPTDDERQAWLREHATGIVPLRLGARIHVQPAVLVAFLGCLTFLALVGWLIFG